MSKVQEALNALVLAVRMEVRDDLVARLGPASGPIMTHKQVDSFTGARIAKSKALGKRVRRSAVDLYSASKEIFAHVKAHPGQRGEQITAALGMSAKEMRKPMAALIASKKIRTAGQRRGMTYTVR